MPRQRRPDTEDLAREAEAPPPLVPRGKTAQITLRLPAAVLVRIRGVAETRSVPHHTLTRSWLIAGIRDPAAPEITVEDVPQDTQLNIRLEREILEALKARALALDRPYHRLARELIEVGLRREEERVVNGEQEVNAGLGRKGVSPYATGGGGVTLERRVAALYLALLLTGDGRPELGKDRAVSSVAFQQNSTSAVDDLIIGAQSASKSMPSLHLAIAVRRAPNFVRSSESTQKLVDNLITALIESPADGGIEHRFALAVAGARDHARHIAELAGLAGKQMNAVGFFDLVFVDGHVKREIRERLEHLIDMVAASLTSLGVDDVNEEQVRRRTWELLSRLSVLTPRVEDPETADWFDVQNSLRRVCRARDLTSAGQLLDRLEVLAGQFAAAGARVDRALLRRHLHGLFDEAATRRIDGWRVLTHLHKQATQVRERLGRGGRVDQLHLDRHLQVDALLSVADGAPALLVHGPSGVGKSALVVHAFTRVAEDSEEIDVLCLDLRRLPVSTLDLATTLGCELATLLRDLSAPRRFLVLDGADAATETRREMLAYVISAARDASVVPVVIVADENRQVVLDLLEDRLEGMPQFAITGLSDDELAQVVSAFPELDRLTKNARSRELLRRLVIVDLLVRSDTSGIPLSDVEGMYEIWAGLVRNGERADRGSPEAREQALLALAEHELTGTPPQKLADRLDPETVDVLRRDGLLKPASGQPWETTPEFAHDELRRYAVARALLIDGNPVEALRRVNAPRWALASAVLASQALLADPNHSATAIKLEVLQDAFDALAHDGHGARWSDVPTEALLGLADPMQAVSAAWPRLRDGEALPRILRLLEQRYTRDGIVERLIAEPIVTLLLDDDTPWRTSKEIADCLRQWLVALVLADSAAGHPVRMRLHDRLIDTCTAAEERATNEAEETRRALARRTQEEVLRDEQEARKNELLFAEIGVGPRTRRRHRTLPHELLDDTLIELLALLGEDLGEDGEHLLRRIADDAPEALAPALEEPFTGRALASYGNGLLADLTEAYYVEEEPNYSFHEDGIRHHDWRGPITPMAAYYRGPFMALLQSEPLRGIAVLNRMLNHAALARSRTLAALGDPWGRPPADFTPQGAELAITGTTRRYIGDEHVWLWYRGTGVGPYPCMSALQACEVFCEQLLEAGVPLSGLVSRLLEGCENLAMVGMVVGLLVRHLEQAGNTIDAFLLEPYIWGYEIRRVVSESSGIAIRQHGVLESERRRWSLRETATWLVLNADDGRAERLREIAAKMITKAERLEVEFNERLAASAEDIQPDADRAVSYVTTVRNWASVLDRDLYHIYNENGQTYVASTPPEDIQEALRESNVDLARGQEIIRLVNRYFIEPKKGNPTRGPHTRAELEADLGTAKELLENPPLSPFDVADAVALVATASLEAFVLRQEDLPHALLIFAGDVLLTVAEQMKPADMEYEGTMFEQGADRTAARGLPLLLLPQAHAIREATGGHTRVSNAALRFARAVPSETRLGLARGLDPLWRVPCAGSPCHHEEALKVLDYSMRDCVLGDWDQKRQRRTVEILDGELPQALQTVEVDRLLPERFDPAIRGLGAASVCDNCVRARARELLVGLTGAQRRALAAHGENFNERGSHEMVAARSLLALAANGDEEPLLAQLSDSTGLRLSTMLRAIAAAAEESETAASAATRLWPTVIDTVLDIAASQSEALGDRDDGERTLAALAPMRVYDVEFLYRELRGAPVEWRNPLAWRDAIERWLPLAAGRSHCVDSLIALIEALPAPEQATIGLDWVRALVLADVTSVGRRSFMLTRWLVDIRPATEEAGSLARWQELVDALVVAGATDLAGYSE